ncbi:cell wall metabolism sensor histidine kinase WalK [Sporosarcina sp. JAI121]|uniref:sensor histidine kinase n=1 Tax=Sporosarcina sp. JAI121 TaxID=2723064 RepID=UPI0015C8F8C8|nr:HAMP domain-containing sensor histidine kinase [Sporosarcina sp. JAI121]NYF25317.1 signal transduction histidine kinase [Sporosarcina sp. JAI121]
MKKLTLSKKILVVLIFSIGFTILFSFFFIHYLYSELYLTSIEKSIVYQGKRTASHYHYGELSDEIIEKIQWYNIVSEYEIIVVDNLEDLTSYFPYKINYETLVDASDRAELERGSHVLKEGFVEELNREILGAIFPIKGENGLIGFIYIYVPLAAVQDVFQDSIPILLIVGSSFFIILFLVVNRAWRSLFRPLQDLQQLSYEVSKGNYSNRIQSDRDDEIGQVTKAFNLMSKSLEQQEERKKEFTSNIVHELRTPLTYISGYTHVLKEKIYSSPEEAQSYLTTIEKETDRLTKLITDLVELNHLQEDLYSIDLQPIAVAQLVVETIDLFAIHIAEKQLNLKLNIEEELIFTGDSKRIQQVFYNTIDNAVKYSVMNGILSIEVTKKDGLLQFQVTNDGILIDDDDLTRIGDRFFRTDKARNRTTGGTGLGLPIVKEIIRLHNGTFSITSDAVSGTTVIIQLPGLSSDIKEEV